jgi:hypothetical protein
LTFALPTRIVPPLFLHSFLQKSFPLRPAIGRWPYLIECEPPETGLNNSIYKFRGNIDGLLKGISKLEYWGIANLVFKKHAAPETVK